MKAQYRRLWKPNSPGRATYDNKPTTSGTNKPRPTSGNIIPMELMRTMIQEIVTTLLQTTSSGIPTPSTVQSPARVRSLEYLYVPSFDPDDGTDTIQVWCHHVEELKEEYHLNEREVLNIARKNLRGRAADWARYHYSFITNWEEFKNELIQTFTAETRYYDDLSAFIDYTSDKASCLEEYATRKWELAKKAVGIHVTEQHLVEAVISGVLDCRIRAHLLRLTPKSLPQLIQNLNSYKPKQSMYVDHDIPPKKIKYNPSDYKIRRCQRCFNKGHLQRNCRTILHNKAIIPTSSIAAQSIRPQKRHLPIGDLQRPICIFCKNPGHQLEQCFKRLNLTKEPKPE